jgi:hypothetical protein
MQNFLFSRIPHVFGPGKKLGDGKVESLNFASECAAFEIDFHRQPMGLVCEGPAIYQSRACAFSRTQFHDDDAATVQEPVEPLSQHPPPKCSRSFR